MLNITPCNTRVTHCAAAGTVADRPTWDCDPPGAMVSRGGRSGIPAEALPAPTRMWHSTETSGAPSSWQDSGKMSYGSGGTIQSVHARQRPSDAARGPPGLLHILPLSKSV